MDGEKEREGVVEIRKLVFSPNGGIFTSLSFFLASCVSCPFASNQSHGFGRNYFSFKKIFIIEHISCSSDYTQKLPCLL